MTASATSPPSSPLGSDNYDDTKDQIQRDRELADKLQIQEGKLAIEQQIQKDTKMAIEIEHRERNSIAAPAGSSSDPPPSVEKRTPFEEIKNNTILDGIIRSITHKGISMDTGHKAIRLRNPEGMTRQELHAGDTITGMKVISVEGEHIIAEVGTLERIINVPEDEHIRPTRDSSTPTSEGTNTSSRKRNRRANRDNPQSHAAAPPLLDASWLRGD
eukprot:16440051-Heterocapsa_arctica.AAC.1